MSKNQPGCQVGSSYSQAYYPELARPNWQHELAYKKPSCVDNHGINCLVDRLSLQSYLDVAWSLWHFSNTGILSLPTSLRGI